MGPIEKNSFHIVDTPAPTAYGSWTFLFISYYIILPSPLSDKRLVCEELFNQDRWHFNCSTWLPGTNESVPVSDCRAIVTLQIHSFSIQDQIYIRYLIIFTSYIPEMETWNTKLQPLFFRFQPSFVKYYFHQGPAWHSVCVSVSNAL